jgi:hypothetical protein
MPYSSSKISFSNRSSCWFRVICLILTLCRHYLNITLFFNLCMRLSLKLSKKLWEAFWYWK